MTRERRIYLALLKAVGNPVGHHTKPNFWDAMRILEVSAPSKLAKSGFEKLDAGVNFFVAALYLLGAKTVNSCEGHPDGFYISFQAPYKLALQIQAAGFFAVDVEGSDFWSLRMPGHDMTMRRGGKEVNKRCHVDALRWAARAWIDHFKLERRAGGRDRLGGKLAAQLMKNFKVEAKVPETFFAKKRKTA